MYNITELGIHLILVVSILIQTLDASCEKNGMDLKQLIINKRYGSTVPRSRYYVLNIVIRLHRISGQPEIGLFLYPVSGRISGFICRIPDIRPDIRQQHRQNCRYCEHCQLGILFLSEKLRKFKETKTEKFKKKIFNSFIIKLTLFSAGYPVSGKIIGRISG